MLLEEFSPLVGKIHETALDPSLWNDVLVRLNRLFRTRSASLFYDDFHENRDGGRRCSVSFHNGTEAGFFDEFLSYYSGISPTYQAAVGTEGMQRVITTPMVIARKAYEQSEYFNDFFRPNRFRDVLVVSFLQSPERAGVLAFRGDLDREPFSAEDIALLGMLWPHVRTACETSARLCELEAIRMASFDALDAMSHGVLLVDSRGGVVHCNREAQRMLDRGDGIAMRDHAVTCVRPDNRRAFDAAMGAEATGSGMPRPVRVDRMTSPIPYLGWTSPVRRLFADKAPGMVDRVLVLNDPTRLNACLPALRELYGLTPLEAKTAIALSMGMDAAAIAESRGISINTVRTQRVRIYSKLGVDNQAQLTCVVMALPQYPVDGV